MVLSKWASPSTTRATITCVCKVTVPVLQLLVLVLKPLRLIVNPWLKRFLQLLDILCPLEVNAILLGFGDLASRLVRV